MRYSFSKGYSGEKARGRCSLEVSQWKLFYSRTTGKTLTVGKSTAVEITNKLREVLAVLKLAVLILPKYYPK